jgi:hypothetical protein
MLVHTSKIFHGVVDIGGTNVDVYSWNKEYTVYKRTSRIPTPSSYNELSSLLKGIVSVIGDLIVIGIPGPISDNSDPEIFCPPLGYSISIKAMEVELGVKPSWCNDVECLCLIATRSELKNISTMRHESSDFDIMISIGTSMGLATNKTIILGEERFTLSRSYEMAHVPIVCDEVLTDLLYSLIERKSDCKSRRAIYYREILSVSGYRLLATNKARIIEYAAVLLGFEPSRLSFDDAYVLVVGKLIEYIVVMLSPDNRRIVVTGGISNIFTQKNIGYINNIFKDASLKCDFLVMR